jgi:hypothetical protein
MKSVLGYLLLAVVVATVIGFSISSLDKPQSTGSGPVVSAASSTGPAADTSVSTQLQVGGEPLESGCPQEGHIKSPSSFDKATITFDNQTAADVKIYWIDFDGKRKFYEMLKAHTAHNQATWVGHVWVVADQADQCIKLDSANAVEQILVIN